MEAEAEEFVSAQLVRAPHLSKGEYVCYVLRSVHAPARTYCGTTPDLRRRLRQHNGIISGGARATESSRPWKLCALVHGFPDASAAHRYEYFTKVKHNKTVYAASHKAGKDSIQRRAALLLAAELRMDPEVRKSMLYHFADPYMKECVEAARGEGVPGTLDACFAKAAECKDSIHHRKS